MDEAYKQNMSLLWQVRDTVFLLSSKVMEIAGFDCESLI